MAPATKWNNQMIVMKFGGTSVEDAAAIKRRFPPSKSETRQPAYSRGLGYGQGDKLVARLRKACV